MTENPPSAGHFPSQIWEALIVSDPVQSWSCLILIRVSEFVTKKEKKDKTYFYGFRFLVHSFCLTFRHFWIANTFEHGFNYSATENTSNSMFFCCVAKGGGLIPDGRHVGFTWSFNYGDLKSFIHLQMSRSNWVNVRQLWKIEFSKVAALFQVCLCYYLAEIIFLRLCFDFGVCDWIFSLVWLQRISKQNLKKIISVKW